MCRHQPTPLTHYRSTQDGFIKFIAQVTTLFKPNDLAFSIIFNGTKLLANPTDNESLHNAMTRAIEQHAGTRVSEWGRCKKAGEHYRYPITLANGTRGDVLVGCNA